MKKWFIALAALALLLIFPTTAMASSRLACSSCNYMQTVSAPDEGEYVNDAYHREYFICQYCGARNTKGLAYHYETHKATCTSQAFCDLCKSYFGDINPDNHNWSEWLPNQFNSNLHYRYCMNIGCSASESESHDGNSNCVTSATCSKCNATYKDTTNHAGPLYVHV